MKWMKTQQLPRWAVGLIPILINDYTIHNNNVLVKYRNKKIRFLKGYNFVR